VLKIQKRETTYIKSIKPQYKKSLIYTRLGYSKTKTLLDEQMLSMLDNGIEEAEDLCTVHGGFRILGIKEISESNIALDNGICFKSYDLATFLKGADQVVFMFSSAGNEISLNIQKEINLGNTAYGVILDAAASVIADAGLDWLMDYINLILKREGKSLSNNRYSPGYGDLTLQNQRTLFDALNMSRYQIELTEKYMLIPEKTVTAIVGII